MHGLRLRPRRGAGRRAGRRGGVLQPRAGRARRRGDPRPQAGAAGRGGVRDRRHGQGRRLDPGAHHAGRRPRRLPGHARVPGGAEHAEPRSAAACSRSPSPTRPLDEDLHRAGGGPLRADRDGRRGARAADGRRGRLLRRRARLLGAARGGVGRRGRAPRDAARSCADARDARGWPGPPSCCGAATRATRSALRRAVASPGGTTARGLAALERGGVRAALAAAMDDVVDDG